MLLLAIGLYDQIHLLYLMYAYISFAYFYHSDNVISLTLSQSDHIKWVPLYHLFCEFKLIGIISTKFSFHPYPSLGRMRVCLGHRGLKATPNLKFFDKCRCSCSTKICLTASVKILMSIISIDCNIFFCFSLFFEKY
jgi:hypothetical protein